MDITRFTIMQCMLCVNKGCDTDFSLLSKCIEKDASAAADYLCPLLLSLPTFCPVAPSGRLLAATSAADSKLFLFSMMQALNRNHSNQYMTRG